MDLEQTGTGAGGSFIPSRVPGRRSVDYGSNNSAILRYPSGDAALFNMGRDSSATNLQQVPSSRVDRLLLQRMRKSQSTTVLYGNEQPPGVELGSGHSTGAEESSIHAEALYPPMTDSGEQEGRLIVVANRLPVSAFKGKDGRWQLQISAGGLVSALMGVGNSNSIWIGWPGVDIEEGPERDALTEAMEDQGYAPVFMDENTCDLHYNGFCNSVLWQLFHYVPLNIDSKLSETRTLQFQWQAHQYANKLFADVILQHYRPGDIVWVQDYHLMPLAAILKEKHPRMKVGFFLHTPFPSSEVYRTLPVREELLRAVLKADLIGFHTYDYARHFVSACTRILGLEGTPAGVEDNGTVTRIAAFPIGIDPDRFTSALEAPGVRANVAQLLNRYAGRKVMLGVDRLDMIKGIPQKLLAFEKFLEEHPEWRDRVLLVQIAVPSRTDVPEYQKLRSMVHEIVGRINGKYGTLTHVPIYHLDRQLSFDELVALYAITDVALVTSLRDGMNLVSYEYVACQRDNAGVLILSEFAGAAQSLGAGALLVNPWNIIDLSQAIEYALTMNDKERRERHRQNYMHVTIHTAQTWADTFLSELNDTHVEAELRTKNIPPALDFDLAVNTYRASKRHLLILGYNATLTTAVEAPRLPKKHFDQIQAMTTLNMAAYTCLKALSKDPNVDIVIFSGSEKERMADAFADLHDVWLAAENGAVIRAPKSKEWKNLLDVSIGECEWKDSVQLVFEYFCERTPRSFVEERGTSLVWNYKYADVEFGRIQARDVLQHLLTGPISNAPVDIIRGARSIEVRPVGVSKGSSMAKMLQYMSSQSAAGKPMNEVDYVFIAGHFLGRDEDVFTLFEGAVGDGEDEEQTTPNWQESGLYSTLAHPSMTSVGSDSMVDIKNYDVPTGVNSPHKGPPGNGGLTPTRSIEKDKSREMDMEKMKEREKEPEALAPSVLAETTDGLAAVTLSGVPDLPLKLPPKYLFTCTVGRTMASQARYCLQGSQEIAYLLYHLCISSGIKPEGLSCAPQLPDLVEHE